MAKPRKTPVRGPYDTPFMTKRQREREAQKRARDAVESIAAIESRTGRERLAAEGITQSFQQMLAQQANAQTNRLSAIQSAAGENVGSGTLAASIAGTTQAAELAPRLAAGRGTEIQAGVNERDSAARKERAQGFRKYLTQSRADIANSEREKQAGQIESAATAKAYDLKLQDYSRGVYESDRNYGLDLAKYEASLAKVDTGRIDDLIPVFTSIAKDSASKRGTGGYEGEITYTDSKDGKQKKIKVKGVNFNPANKSVAERDAFWKKYVEQKTGFMISGNVIRNVERGETKRPPSEVAKLMFDSAGTLGSYSSAEIFQAIMRTPFGMMNAAAVREAYQGM
jgi:hypothetical protein